APPPIVVGHVALQSGPDRDAGEHASRGITLAVKEFNKGAEAPERPVVVPHTDTRGQPEAFEAEAVRLVNVNKAVALLGGTSAAEVEALDKARVPVVTPSGLRTSKMSDVVFLVGLSPAAQGKALARFAAEELPEAPGVVILADDRREEALRLADAF